MYSCENGYCLTSSIEHKRTFKTSQVIALTFLLQDTMSKQEILDWLKDMKKEDPKTYQLLLLTILEQIQKDLGK